MSDSNLDLLCDNWPRYKNHRYFHNDVDIVLYSVLYMRDFTR